MPILNIQGQIISAPDSGADPNWSPAVIQFMEAVTIALQGVAGDFDVSPQVFTIDSFNPGVNVAIPLLSFPVSNVLSVQINYSVIRTTTTVNIVDAGVITMVFNTNNPTGSKWEVTRQGVVDGGAGITFTVTDAGVVEFTSNTQPGLNHTGRICYSAEALTFA